MLHRSSVLSTLGAAASFVVFFVVISAYFIVAMVQVFRPLPAHPEAAAPSWVFSVGDGLVSLGHWNIPSNAPPPEAGTFSPGTDRSCAFRPILYSSVPDALWGFRSYTQRFSTGGLTVSWVSAPVWPLLAVSGIHPVRWYRRRAKSRARGFQVEAAAKS